MPPATPILTDLLLPDAALRCLAQFSAGTMLSIPLNMAAFLLYVFLCLAPILLISAILYNFISLPVKRRERARFFLDLIENGIKAGQSPEQTVVQAAATHDSSPGVRFHMVAAHVEGGCRLHEALLREPRLLPAQMNAMINAAALNGDLKSVLPACRNLLKDGISQGHRDMNWQPLLFFILSPVQLWLVWILFVFVTPRLAAIMSEIVPSASTSAWFRLMNDLDWLWLSAVIFIYVSLMGGLVTMVGGPRLEGWLRLVFGQAWDALIYALPWRRHRMHRDFSTLLALCLDQGVPEDQAVRQAASCTVNQRFLRKADLVVHQLHQGVSLPQAIRKLDHRKELAWRLSNALRQPGKHHEALAGWCASLDAKAFQQEQAAAQSITTGLVLLNGFTIGLVAIGVFSVLITILEEALLW